MTLQPVNMVPTWPALNVLHSFDDSSDPPPDTCRQGPDYHTSVISGTGTGVHSTEVPCSLLVSVAWTMAGRSRNMSQWVLVERKPICLIQVVTLLGSEYVLTIPWNNILLWIAFLQMGGNLIVIALKDSNSHFHGGFAATVGRSTCVFSTCGRAVSPCSEARLRCRKPGPKTRRPILAPTPWRFGVACLVFFFLLLVCWRAWTDNSPRASGLRGIWPFLLGSDEWPTPTASLE